MFGRSVLQPPWVAGEDKALRVNNFPEWAIGRLRHHFHPNPTKTFKNGSLALVRCTSESILIPRVVHVPSGDTRL